MLIVGWNNEVGFELIAQRAQFRSEHGELAHLIERDMRDARQGHVVALRDAPQRPRMYPAIIAASLSSTKR